MSSTLTKSRTGCWLSVAETAGDGFATETFAGLGVTVAAPTGNEALVSTYTEMVKIFKITDDGATATIEHTIDNGGKRLRIALDSAIETTVGPAKVKAGFDFDKAGSVFKLISGDKAGIQMTVGAMQNASYTADPYNMGTLFKLDDLFSLELKTPNQEGKTDATALVAERFNKWAVGEGTSVTLDTISSKVALLQNLTTNQNIQKRQVALTLTGDFSGIKVVDGYLYDATAGTKSKWKVSGNEATMMLAPSTDGSVLNGYGTTANTPAAGSNADVFAPLSVDEKNETPINAQGFQLKAEMVDSSATFDAFEKLLANVFIVKRDGLKFDTILTGTTSSNTIHIRDVSGILPEDGGKIFVTVWEYDAHEDGQNAKKNVLAERQELTVKLPANGAVTLSPATIAADLGIDVAPARQARMVFEVETNMGEVAVKKSDGKGTDIQVGSQAAGKVVDFTL
ncbi:S-layer protein [Vibrio vulnificus]|uniref:VapA family S-layer protein n=1 Tax=Vibrio vulnificus TaxID=672 RepID=UPI00102982F1|nr:S-layer protein [Vibrio vulnificus]